MPRKKATTKEQDDGFVTVEIDRVAVAFPDRTIFPKNGKASVTPEEYEQLKEMGIVNG